MGFHQAQEDDNVIVEGNWKRPDDEGLLLTKGTSSEGMLKD